MCVKNSSNYIVFCYQAFKDLIIIIIIIIIIRGIIIESSYRKQVSKAKIEVYAH